MRESPGTFRSKALSFRGRHVMASCECGCGQESGLKFLPGHDQKLRARLEARIGGILRLRELVDASEAYAHGKSSDEVFTQRVRSLFTATRSGEHRSPRQPG